MPISLTLFVSGLPDSASEDVLVRLFEAAGGGAAAVTLPRDREANQPRGFAFVVMSTAASAQAALVALDGSIQLERRITVRRFGSATTPATVAHRRTRTKTSAGAATRTKTSRSAGAATRTTDDFSVS